MIKLNVPVLLPLVVTNCNNCCASFVALPVTCVDGDNEIRHDIEVAYCPFCGKEIEVEP